MSQKPSRPLFQQAISAVKKSFNNTNNVSLLFIFYRNLINKAKQNKLLIMIHLIKCQVVKNKNSNKWELITKRLK